jgi:hypothetical protein
MCESVVVVGAALSADVDAPTERVHSAPGARRGQNRLSNRRANVPAVRTQRRFASGATETAELARFAVSPTNRRGVARSAEADHPRTPLLRMRSAPALQGSSFTMLCPRSVSEYSVFEKTTFENIRKFARATRTNSRFWHYSDTLLEADGGAATVQNIECAVERIISTKPHGSLQPKVRSLRETASAW